MKFDVKTITCQMSIYEDNSNKIRQSLKIKAEIQVSNQNSKKNQFQAIIKCKESVRDVIIMDNFTKYSTIQSLIPISLKLKKDEQNNNICILKWKIPMNKYLSKIIYNQNLFLNSQQQLELLYRENNQIARKLYIIQFNNLYEVDSLQQLMNKNYLFFENQKVPLEQEIQHQLILKRSNNNIIPITLKLNQTVFKLIDDKKLEIKLQSQCLQHPFPKVRYTFYQKIVYHQIQKHYYNKLTETSQDQQFTQKQEIIEDNNCEVNFQIDLNPLEKIIPLYIGQNIELHHLILIQIIFDKKNCCDFSQRIFDIFVPIQIVTKDQIVAKEENQNKNPPDQQNVNKQKQDNIIEVNFWPQFCEQYQNYFKVEVLNEQKLIIKG